MVAGVVGDNVKKGLCLLFFISSKQRRAARTELRPGQVGSRAPHHNKVSTLHAVESICHDVHQAN